MVGRPLAPGVNTRMVIGIGVRVIKVGVEEISELTRLISMSVVIRNMTETMTCPGVTLISKHKFLSMIRFCQFILHIIPILWVVLT